MKLYVFLLILAAFLQTSIIPINLVLILLIIRSFLIEDKANYLASFFLGILLGILSSSNVGYWSLIFLLVVKIVYLTKKLPFFENASTFLLLSFILVLFVNVSSGLILKQTIDYRLVLIEALVSLPIFWLIRLWEERFVVKSDIRLKIKK
ncbi:hypothetical protein HYS93_04595 [Candidatus Daviesbacteria bacterium]|nr:hypothetical protein [Candidatus Daviesbacteria bacterium]